MSVGPYWIRRLAIVGEHHRVPIIKETWALRCPACKRAVTELERPQPVARCLGCGRSYVDIETPARPAEEEGKS